MMTYELRPLSTGEILDGALVLLRRNFRLLLVVALLCQGIPTVMDVYIEFTGGVSQNRGLNLLNQLLSIVGGVLVTGATVRVVSEAYLGRTPALGEAMRFAGSRFWTIFGSNIISGFLIVLGTLALIIPGIILACGYSVSAAAAGLESGSASDAVQHSWDLTKGFRWKALVLWVVTVALILVMSVATGVVAGFVGGLIGTVDPVVAVLGSVVLLVVYPMVSCVFTLFYYDLRVRKEGFDIEMLSSQMSIAPA